MTLGAWERIMTTEHGAALLAGIFVFLIAGIFVFLIASLGIYAVVLVWKQIFKEFNS